MCFAAYELGVPFVMPFVRTGTSTPFVRTGTSTPFVVAIIAAGETVGNRNELLEYRVEGVNLL